jgi:S1-C subfamily serine protease
MSQQLIVLCSLRDPQSKVQVTASGLRVGRGSDNQLILRNTQVSRQHAVIQYENGQPVLTDLNSGVGTFVNNQRIRRIALSPGDLIAFGPEQWRVELLSANTASLPFANPAISNPALKNLIPILGGILLLGLIVTVVLLTKRSAQPVHSFTDVQPAVIRIIIEGTFVKPEGTEYNAGYAGSGFIIDPSGIAVTNNHVVTGAALLRVTIGGDQSHEYNAKILGVSECSDLAVIDIEGDGFPYLKWSNEPVKIGMDVYSAGFPLGAPEFALTRGIVSKEDVTGANTDWASVSHIIMHDARINHGNSGGPLVNASGDVVGVNYMGSSATDQNYAIRGDIAKDIVNQLRTGKDLDTLGLNGQAMIFPDKNGQPMVGGLWVVSVKSGSPADRTGIQPGDLIVEMESIPLVPIDGGYPVATMENYCNILRTHSSTDQLSATVIRFVDGGIIVLEGKINGSPLEQK